MDEMDKISQGLHEIEGVLDRDEKARIDAIDRVAPWSVSASATSKDLAASIDHTLLAPDATLAQITTLCQEARQWHTFAVCINPEYVPAAKEALAGCPVKVATVAGFPLGATASAVKAFEASWAVKAGADEIDMVINRGALKEARWRRVLDDIRAVREAVPSPTVLKVILETATLSYELKIVAALLSVAAGADFVKTSTGFDRGGATVEDVRLLRRVVGSHVGVKAAGGVRSRRDALEMVAAGADRLGSSRTCDILEEPQELGGGEGR